jgi:hypothetical protein
MDVAVLALLYRCPAEGVPTLHSWVSTLKQILWSGFENWREVMEIKCTEDPMPCGQPMKFGTILPVKGLGRVSMILWAIIHTYKNMELSNNEPLKQDFLRLWGIYGI